VNFFPNCALMEHTYLALLINQHQPLLRDLRQTSPRGAYRDPWVRLYAAKDYYQMAALLGEHPRVRATVTMMPSLVWQLRDYADNGATDVDFELSSIPASALSAEQRQAVIERFFRASFDQQLLASTRYMELYTKRLSGNSFSEQDLTDLQVWFNLVWVHPVLRERRTQLPDGTWLDLRALVTQAAGFSHEDVETVLSAHTALVRNVIPLHKALADRGQLELATGPFYAPILPLLWDSATAVLDRAATELPGRFQRPADVRAQVEQAAAFHEQVFGRRPWGLWPPEGALCEGVADLLEDAGFEWTVVAKSALQPGDEPLDLSDLSLFTHPWRAPLGRRNLAVFPRESWLSDHLEQLYAHDPDYPSAAREALSVVQRATRFEEPDPFEDEVVTVAVDGDHPWTSYRRNGIDFLRALFAELSGSTDLLTTTFHEYLAGTENKQVAPHPVRHLPVLKHLRCSSRSDEAGSEPGADLGRWIGERSENEAWDVLRRVGAELDAVPGATARFPLSFQSLMAAEESGTFRWLGDDNDPPPGKQSEQVALFKMHLGNVYHLSQRSVPPWLDRWDPLEGAGRPEQARPTAT
jgi:alpha-amylase/alpha-mannosidase (GH57 family)